MGFSEEDIGKCYNTIQPQITIIHHHYPSKKTVEVLVSVYKSIMVGQYIKVQECSCRVLFVLDTVKF